MKKLFSKLVAAAIALSLMFVFAACGVKYDGNFTEVSEVEKKAELASELETIINGGVEEWSGYKMSFEVKLTAFAVGTETVGDGYVKIEDGKLTGMSIESDATMFGVKIVSNTYFKDNYIYSYTKAGDEESKTKMNLTDMGQGFEEFIGAGLDVNELTSSFDDIISASDFKIFTTAESGNRNIKITNADETLYIIVVLDKDNKIKGIKIEGEIIESGIVMQVSQTTEPWSGNIKYPKDLEEYKDMPLTDIDWDNLFG